MYTTSFFVPRIIHSVLKPGLGKAGFFKPGFFLALWFLSSLTPLAATEVAPDLNVMSFNILYTESPENNWPTRRPGMVELFEREDPDIIAMQEVRPNQFTELSQDLAATYTMIWPGVMNSFFGNAIAYRTSRFNVVSSGHFIYSRTPETNNSNFTSGSPRYAYWAVLHDIPAGRDVFVLSTHFYSSIFDSRQERLWSAQLLKGRLQSLAHGLPMIIMGDFNMRDTSFAYATMVEDFPPLTDTYRHIHPVKDFSNEGTTIGFGRTVSTWHRIDYIFSAHMEIQDADIVRDIMFDGVNASDHYPVNATLAYPPADDPDGQPQVGEPNLRYPGGIFGAGQTYLANNGSMNSVPISNALSAVNDFNDIVYRWEFRERPTCGEDWDDWTVLPSSNSATWTWQARNSSLPIQPDVQLRRGAARAGSTDWRYSNILTLDGVIPHTSGGVIGGHGMDGNGNPVLVPVMTFLTRTEPGWIENVEDPSGGCGPVDYIWQIRSRVAGQSSDWGTFSDNTARTGPRTLITSRSTDIQVRRAAWLEVGERIYTEPVTIEFIDPPPVVWTSPFQGVLLDDSGTLTVTVTAQSAKALTRDTVKVPFSVSGTAWESGYTIEVDGSTLLPGQDGEITIPPGATEGTATLTLTPDPASTNGSGTVVLTIGSVDYIVDGDVAFSEPNGAVHTIEIRDNTAPVVFAGQNRSATLDEPLPWTPAEASTPVTAWYDASDVATITTSDGRLSEWRDKSGNGYHATQNTTADQPATGGAINSLNAIDFNPGAGKQHLNTTLEQLTTVSIYLVVDPTARGANGYSAAIGASAAGFRENSGLFWPLEQWGDGTERNDVYYTNSRLAERFCNGVKGSANHNFQPAILSHQGTNLPTANLNYLIGNRSHDLQEIFAFKGLMGEIVICPEAHDEATRLRMEGYLSHKWGLVANLPGDHPYKTEAPTGEVLVASIILNEASATDADDDVVITTWSVVSAPPGGTVTFDDVNLLHPTVTFDTPGIYVLRLTGDDGFETVYDEITITVGDGSGPVGFFDTWSGGAAFDADTSGDGISNGMAWLLGASGPGANALSHLPEATYDADTLRLSFRVRNSVSRDGAIVRVQTSNDLGASEAWESNQAAVPDASSTINGIVFTITPDEDMPGMLNVIVEIPAAGPRRFARISGELP